MKGGRGDSRGDPNLFSYSRENLQASRSLQGDRQPPGPFFVTPLPEPEEEWRTVDVNQLCRFFAHPVKFLLRQRLQIGLEAGDDTIEDREAFDLDALERYWVRESLLTRHLAQQDPRAALELERAAGRLPHGQVGECRFKTISREVSDFYLSMAPYVSGPMQVPVTFELDLDRFRLLGRLDSLTETGLVRFRSAKVKARDRLHLWIRHLALNAVEGPDHSPTKHAFRTGWQLDLHAGTGRQGTPEAARGNLLEWAVPTAQVFPPSYPMTMPALSGKANHRIALWLLPEKDGRETARSIISSRAKAMTLT